MRTDTSAFVIGILFITPVLLVNCSGSDHGNAADLPDENTPESSTANCQTISINGKHAQIELQQQFSSIQLDQPVMMVQAPDGRNDWFVVEREGLILRLTDNEPALEVADFSDRSASGGLEQGLLGIAFHPDYPITRELFVSYTDLDGDSVISRFRVNADEQLDMNSERIVLTQNQPFSNHNGGHIGFGKDGYLYIGFGDGGSAGDPQDNARNTGNWLGTLLRIDVSQSPYSIPGDNPFSGSSGCTGNTPCAEIWAWGLRNPWRFSFDSETGELWVGDVGQDQWEEINKVEKGKNYGWPCFEGTHDFDPDRCDKISSYAFPLAEYSHEEGRSVTGGYVYRGEAIPLLKGQYLYADFLSGHLWGLDVSRQNIPPTRLIESSGLKIASFAQSAENELYLVDFAGGIYQLKSCSKDGN